MVRFVFELTVSHNTDPLFRSVVWLYVKTIGYTAAESVYKMRRALIKEHAEKQNSKDTLRGNAEQIVD